MQRVATVTALCRQRSTKEKYVRYDVDVLPFCLHLGDLKEEEYSGDSLAAKRGEYINWKKNSISYISVRG